MPNIVQLPYDIPTPLEYFKSLVESDVQFPLLEAAASLAHDESPELDLQQVLGDVDQLLARLKRRLPADASALLKLRLLNQFFYADMGFGPALNDFYEADNSYLHAVLKTRRGIPISLAVIWLELAQGVGLNAQGVSFPGHFMVKINLPKGQVVIDPLTGNSLGREELSERLEPFKRRSGLEGDFEMPLGLYLMPATPREVLLRMLRNLKEIHKSGHDAARLLPVLDRLLLVEPDSWPDLRDRGLAHAELGHATQAVLDLQTYVKQSDGAHDSDWVLEKISQIRRAVS